mgnify:FL=1
MAGDDVGPGVARQRPNVQRWDTKKKKFVQGDGTGSDNQRLIRSETGLKLPASYRSGRFDEWRKEQQVEMPRVGDDERTMSASAKRMAASLPRAAPRHRGFHHTQTKAPKPLDKARSDYGRKLKARQRKDAARTARDEVKSAAQIYKERETAAKRKEKNARPTRKRTT